MQRIFRNIRVYLFDLWQILKSAGEAFSDNNDLKFSASLSYYTIFSLAPTLIVIIAVAGFFYGQEAIQGKVYSHMHGLVGDGAANQVQELIKHAHISNQSTMATIIGLVTLFIGATGIFLEIQGSINYIWFLKTKPKKGIIKFLFGQLSSFSMVLSLGFLFLVSLMLNTFLDMFFEPLQHLIAGVTIHLVYLVNLALTFIIITVLFGAIFKVLPDGKLRMKDAVIGAGFTSILFMIGKFLIGFYLGRTNTMSIYGSASSIVALLLWVYYCSIILYFGAEFTRAYATKFGKGITPKSYAMFMEHYVVPKSRDIELENDVHKV